MDGLIDDLRHGFRMLLRTPLLSLVAALTIGLGVGATSFAFTVAYDAVLRGPPVRDVDRLTVVTRTRPAEGEDRLWVPIHDYLDFRDEQTSFEHLAAYHGGTVNLGGEEGPPERYQGGFVSARMLSMLGVPPLLGRTFSEGDDTPGAPALILLGHGAWTNRFGSDSSVVSRSVRVNGETATVIGVMPEGFEFPFNTDVWVPLRTDPDVTPRGDRPLMVAGYVRPGVTREAAGAEVAAIASRIAATFPEHNEGTSAEVWAFTAYAAPPQIKTMMALLVVMVAGVLLVACANVANVLLARAVVREKEVAIRSALGARRWRVVRQLLFEAVAIGVAGGLVGLVVAWIGLNFFRGALVDTPPPYWMRFQIDAPALLFTSLITLCAAVAAGTMPALRASGGALGTVLRDESRGTSSLRVGRFATMLVIGELAVSCGLMIGAGLLVRALVDLNRLDLGFDPEPVMTARLGLFETDYPDTDARNRFYHQLLERVASERGIASATLTSTLPGVWQARLAARVEGESYATDRDVPSSGAITIGPGFFDTFGVALLEGRDFRADESRPGAEPVVIVNRSFAEQRFGARDAIGRRIRVGPADADEPWMRIIGVVPDLYEGVGAFGSGGLLREMIYRPIGVGDPSFMTLAVRTHGPPAQAVSDLRGAVAEIDPNLPLFWVRTMNEALDQTTWMHRIFGTLFAIFGGAALFLAAFGLYGVIDFSVSSRMREMGLRMALGAEPRDILRIVLRRVSVQLGTGVAIGLGLGALLARPLAATLFGVESWDAVVYATIVGTLMATGLLAALVPALRAVRVDPLIAFRA